MDIPEDKLLHFIAGLVVAVLAFMVTGTPWASIVASIVVGIGKEVYDAVRKDGRVADAWDAVATIMPGVLVFMFVTYGGT